jgi:hypothetical protein
MYRSRNSSNVEPSQRSIYIKNGDFLGIIAYLIEGSACSGGSRKPSKRSGTSS